MPTLPAIHHNLPPQPTSFIGREVEIAQITALLDDPACRLLTLVGPGGIGKTRLALEVAARKLNDFHSGVFFVALQPLTSHEHIVPSVAVAVGYQFQPDNRDPRQQLLDYFENKSILLLMDNFEHLLDGVSFLTDLLTAAPDVMIVVTSRIALNLRGEWLYDVRGLHISSDDHHYATKTGDALRLFVERSQRVSHHFALSEQQKGVIRICQIVNGMPLALELASTWTRTLSCDEIADEIQRGLAFLNSPLRDVPERHQSMRAVFDWSWRLLPDDERNVFRKLSVFRGGFSRNAAHAVAGAPLNTLLSLRDRSLIQRNDQTGRYEIHELLRQYGAEQLAMEREEYRATYDLHAAFYAEMAYKYETNMNDELQLLLTFEIQTEYENIDRAWRWALNEVDIENLNKFPRTLGYYLQNHGLFDNARVIFEQMINVVRSQSAGAIRDNALGRLLSHQGWTLHMLGQNEQALHSLDECLQLLNESGSEFDVALSMNFQGRVRRILGDYDGADHILQRALAISHKIESVTNFWLSLSFLGENAYDWGEYEAARHYLEAAIRAAENASSFGGHLNIPVLCMTYVALGEFQLAKQSLVKALSDNENPVHGFQLFLLLAAIAVYLRTQNEVVSLVQLAIIVTEHPMCTDDLKSKMHILLVETKDSLSIDVFNQTRNRAHVILESARQNDVILPRDYLVELHQILEKTSPVTATLSDTVLSRSFEANMKLADPLTERELEILNLISTGLANSEIAQRLYISIKTVKRHNSNIFNKLSAENRTHAVTIARDLGLLD